MRGFAPPELIELAAKFQRQAKGGLQDQLVLLGDTGSDGISLTGQEVEKTSIVTTPPALWGRLCGDQGAQITHCFADWVSLAAVRLDPMRGISLGTWDPGNL